MELTQMRVFMETRSAMSYGFGIKHAGVDAGTRNLMA
jgi:hypothetical protein